MTVSEIFGKLSEHMVEGLMIHAQMSDYYGFLNLKGYQECHKYHYFSENANYRKLNEYYLSHYNKLIYDGPIDNPHIIPESWYNFSKYDVNVATRKSAIQSGMEKWVNWERDTKKFYENMYQELVSLGDIAAASEICKYIDDVSDELKHAERKLLELKAIDYDIFTITQFQEALCELYKEKIKEIEL